MTLVLDVEDALGFVVVERVVVNLVEVLATEVVDGLPGTETEPPQPTRVPPMATSSYQTVLLSPP